MDGGRVRGGWWVGVGWIVRSVRRDGGRRGVDGGRVRGG